MSERYGFQHGKLKVYDVVSETDKMMTVTNRYMFVNSGKPQRMSKDGTYATAREALTEHLRQLKRDIAREESFLDLKKQVARKYAQILNDTPDEKLVEAIQKA